MKRKILKIGDFISENTLPKSKSIRKNNEYLNSTKKSSKYNE